MTLKIKSYKIFHLLYFVTFHAILATEIDKNKLQDEINKKENEKKILETEIDDLKKKKFEILKATFSEYPFEHTIRILGSFGPLQSSYNIASDKSSNERRFSLSFPKDYFEYYNANKNNSFFASYYNKKYNFGLDFNTISFRSNINGSFILLANPSFYSSNQKILYESSIFNVFKLFKIFENHNVGPSFGIIYNYGKFSTTSYNFTNNYSILKESYSGVGPEIGIRYKTRISENLFLDFGYNAFTTKNDFSSNIYSNLGEIIFSAKMIGQNPELHQFNYSGRNNYTINGERSFVILDYILNSDLGISFGWQNIYRVHRINNASIDEANSLSESSLRLNTFNREINPLFLAYYQTIQSKSYSDFIFQFSIGFFRMIN